MTSTPDEAWYGRTSVEVAPDLLGCVLHRRVGRKVRSGIIVETEAYGPGDPACHGFVRRTARNAAIFGRPGSLYVYLIYGIYHCLNVVTDQEGVPSAVLIRALDMLTPTPGVVEAKQPHRAAAGPGKLCRALDIDLRLNEHIMRSGSALWIEAGVRKLDRADIVQTTRIGLNVGVETPWRWYVRGSAAVSKK